MKQSTSASARGRAGKTTAKKSSAQRSKSSTNPRSGGSGGRTSNNSSDGRTSSSSSGRTSNSSGGRTSSSSSGQNSGSSRSSGSGESSGGRSGQMRANNPSSGTKSRGQSARHGSRREHSRHGGHFEGSSPLEKFFLDQLKDIYYAEQVISQALPAMQEAATTEDLKDAFEDHLSQTQRHIKRLEKVFGSIGQKAEGEKCDAIEGISKEMETIIDETEEGTLTRDAALIIAAQKVEHYEIASYGGLVQLAITMELNEAADLLDRTLIEEEDTDAKLTMIAENYINLRAEHEGGRQSGAEEGEEEEEEEEGEESDEETEGSEQEAQ